MYAKIKDNQLVEYPFDLENLKQANPHTSFPSNFYNDFVSLLEYGVVLVHPSSIPEYDSKTHKLVEDTPNYVENQWVQSWKVIPLTPEELQDHLELFKKDISNKVQARLDTFANTRGYDNILSATTYVNSSISKFALEAQYALLVRDATWNKVYEIFSEIDAGTRQMPASYSEIEQELPILEWPSL